jgi:hypothetical protein
MKRLAASILVALSFAGPALADPNPMPRDGERIAFDVYRQGDTRFGVHEVEFSHDGEDIIAEVNIRLRAGLGPVTVFRYEHNSTERWREGQLLGLSGRTLKDGETFDVQAQYSGGAINVDGLDPELNPVDLEVEPSILSSSHWHGYPVEMERMLNTEHGTVMETEITYMGQVEIEGDGGMITVDHYRLSSDLVVDLYYDLNGRWAGCEFDARGQSVRYVRRANPVDA